MRRSRDEAPAGREEGLVDRARAAAARPGFCGWRVPDIADDGRLMTSGPRREFQFARCIGFPHRDGAAIAQAIEALPPRRRDGMGHCAQVDVGDVAT